MMARSRAPMVPGNDEALNPGPTARRLLRLRRETRQWIIGQCRTCTLIEGMLMNRRPSLMPSLARGIPLLALLVLAPLALHPPRAHAQDAPALIVDDAAAAN